MNPRPPVFPLPSTQATLARLVPACLVAVVCVALWATGPALAAPDEGITLAEAAARMAADGSLDQFVTTRAKAGRRVMPKYASKSWDVFVSMRVAEGEKALPHAYREEALAETLRHNMQRSATLAAPSWTYIGPDGSGGVQPSGRLVELALHPTNADIIYAAAASGGIYKTTNGGTSWTNVTDGYLPSIGMGSVTVDPFTPTTIYCGLGEGVPGSFYEPYGAGVYRSTNSGSTWALVPGTGSFEYVTDIKVVGTSQNIYVAAKGRSDGSGGGVFRSTNGGTSWSQIGTGSFFSIEVNPGNFNNIVVGTGYYNPGTAEYCRIYYTTDGGASWFESFPGFVWNNTNTYRIELQASASNVFYALVGMTDSSLGGILRSTDGGQSWSLVGGAGIPTSGDYKPGQMNYNCSIGVSPRTPGIVYLGSNLRMYRSSDNGANFAAGSDWAGDSGLPYVHADHHSIRFGSTDSTVFFGTDGGFFKSTNGGTTWTEMNIGFNALQCYSIDNHPTDPNVYIMGLQDNDKYLRRSNGTWHHYPNTWGDGMEMIVYPSNTTTYMGSNYYGGAVRITEDAGANWYFLRTYGAQNNGIPDTERGAWVVPFLLDPQNPNTLYLMVRDLYRATYTPGFLPTWTKIIDFDDNFAPQNVERMILTAGPTGRKLVGFNGRYNGNTGQYPIYLWRANPDGTSFEQMNLPQTAWVNALAADPNNNNTIWIGFSNVATGVANRARIFRSTNLGTSWTDMTNNFPQNLPVGAIWIDPNNSNNVIVGSDIGVYRSENGGASWSFWNDGLPLVVVNDFAYFAPQRKLRAGTYGRGIYETPLDGVTPGASATDIREFLLGRAGQPANADRNANSRIEVGDAVMAVNAGAP